jgi:hypothetical protein
LRKDINEKIELLKQKIAEICNNNAYSRNIYNDDCYLFVIENNQISVIDEDSIDGYFIPNYTEEDEKEVERIKAELNLNWEKYLPIIGGVASDLSSLIEYYEDIEEDEAKIEEIERLVEVLSQKDSIFFNREHIFLNIFLHPDLESGIAYVHRQWDHYLSYYLNLPFSTGVNDPLYDIIENDSEFVIDSDEEDDEICDYWIDILDHLEDYILLKNQ